MRGASAPIAPMAKRCPDDWETMHDVSLQKVRGRTWPQVPPYVRTLYKQRQITERFDAKLPNKLTPNYRKATDAYV